MNFNLFIYKITRFEFWPYWFFYLPTVPYVLYLMIKARKATYFTNVNPAMYLSGITNVSKSEILSKLPKKYTIKSKLILREKISSEELIKTLKNEFAFPIIVKPNMGERGKGVEKINSLNHFNSIKHKYQEDIIIQDYIDFEHEFGVMYYRIPGTEEYKVTSIVEKGFLEVKGDGKQSVRELLLQNKRALIVWDYLEEKLHDTWNYIPEKGEEVQPQPIGNHCKGTMFKDANNLNNSKVTELFHNISKEYAGFNYGRYDVKVKSLEDLETGDNLKIMELNGVTSEPAHVYDPKMPLWKAYRDVYQHFKIVYKISIANSKLGYKTAPWNEFVGLMRMHYSKTV